MSAQRKRQLSAAEIKEKFPEEWEKLQIRVAEKSKPDLPSKIYREMEVEAKELFEGVYYNLPPSSQFPFTCRCLLQWEEDVHPTFQQLEQVLPRPGASKAEKRLLSLLDAHGNDNDHERIKDAIFDRVANSPGWKQYARRIKAFCIKGEKLEKEYSFDFQKLLDKFQYEY